MICIQDKIDWTCLAVIKIILPYFTEHEKKYSDSTRGREFLPPRSKWELQSYRLLRQECDNSLSTFRENLSVQFSMVTIVNLQDGTDRLSPKHRQGNTTTLLVITEKRAVPRNFLITRAKLAVENNFVR